MTFAYERGDLPFSFAQRVQWPLAALGLSSAPGPHAQAPQAEIRHLLLGGRTHGSGQLAGLTKLFRRPAAVTRLECRGKVQPRPQERSHQAEPPPLCNESLELGNSGQVMPGDCKESRHVATPQRVVQDRVASVFVPAFELTFGLFDSTARMPHPP